jgi:hypothetical protein
MSQDLFARIRSLLQDHVLLLNEHKLGDTHVEDAEAIIEEINILLKSNKAGEIEKRIAVAERQAVSDDLADEIINGKYCIGGTCED